MRADLVEVATPFCHGLPGSMNAVSICAVSSQRSTALATNSGPLSERRCFWRAALGDEVRKNLDDAAGADTAIDLDR